MLYQAPPNLCGYFVGTKEDFYLIYESGLRPLYRVDEINFPSLASSPFQGQAYEIKAGSLRVQIVLILTSESYQ